MDAMTAHSFNTVNREVARVTKALGRRLNAGQVATLMAVAMLSAGTEQPATIAGLSGFTGFSESTTRSHLRELVRVNAVSKQELGNGLTVHYLSGLR